MLRGPTLLRCLGVYLCPTRVGVVASRTLRSARGPRPGSAFDENFGDMYSPNTAITATDFGAVRLDKNNVPQEHGEFEMKPKQYLGFDPADPREDLEGIIERTSTQVAPPDQPRHHKTKGETTNNTADESKIGKNKKKQKFKPQREIYEGDIHTVRKAAKAENPNPAEPTRPKSAFDAVKEIRDNLESEEAELTAAQRRYVDSKGFRIMKAEVEPPLQTMNHEQILQSLRRRVVVDTPEVLVINKPYGLSMHGGGDVDSKSKFALTAYLKQLAEFFRAEKLYTVHRLDKEATGVLCLAKNAHIANVIETMFQAHQVKKEYRAITKGVTKLRKGVIELPISVGHISGKERMVIVPRPPPGSKKSVPKFTKVFEARTEYEILSYQSNVAYWKLNPLTGYKHQIRVHLGFGLQCPILGDHKYSHIKKLVPQRLPSDVLHLLNVQQSKVREIPLHLHSQSIVVPGILAGGKNLVARINPPKLFRKTLEQLKLA